MSQTIPFTHGLTRLNTPLAQTWNYLKINGIDLELPELARKGAVVGRLPRVFGEVEVSVGKDAVEWIEHSADDARYFDVKSKEGELIVLDADVDKHEVKDSGVIVRQGAKATIVVLTYGKEQGEKAAVSANLVRIIAEANSEVEIYEVVAVANADAVLHSVGVCAQSEAQVTDRQYILEGTKNITSTAVELKEKAATLDLSCRYFAKNSDIVDTTHTVRQRGPLSESKLVASGLLLDSAQKTLRETIDLIHGAKGATGNEVETVLIAGDKVINKTLPTILCDEDDVQGNHGASIGSISQAQLDYLASRGVSEEAAYSLFARSIFDDALIHAPHDVAKRAVYTSATHVLGQEIADDIAQTLGFGALTQGHEEEGATC